jgi:cytidylate kinase
LNDSHSLNSAKRLTIAIDGPSGAGKSTVARRLASLFGYTYIDTGAMYRAAALRGLQAGVPLEEEAETIALTEAMELTFQPGENDTQRVWMNGEDVTEQLRTAEVTRLSSPVSAIPGVRKVLVALQQAMGAGGGVVMEGRDIGTVVFPNADVKVFLTASEEERARRRWRERTAKGDTVTLQEILLQQRERDTRDSSRADSPLQPAPDAVILDSDHMDFDTVVDWISDRCREAQADATGAGKSEEMQ